MGHGAPADVAVAVHAPEDGAAFRSGRKETSRVPDRGIFGKLVQVLVFGCACWRIADGSCSESTLRRRRDEWIGLGVMDALREMALTAYDRFIGLDLAEVAGDGCVTKVPCGGEKAGRSPVDRGNGAPSARQRWTLTASP